MATREILGNAESLLLIIQVASYTIKVIIIIYCAQGNDDNKNCTLTGITINGIVLMQTEVQDAGALSLLCLEGSNPCIVLCTF